MLNTLLAFVIATATPAGPARLAVASDTLHCRVAAVKDAKARRCAITIPPGRAIRVCASSDAAAGHCDKRANRRYVTWVAERNGAKCKLSRKRSDWTQVVVMRMTEKTPAGQAACDLYVVLHR